MTCCTVAYYISQMCIYLFFPFDLKCVISDYYWNEPSDWVSLLQKNCWFEMRYNCIGLLEVSVPFGEPEHDYFCLCGNGFETCSPTPTWSDLLSYSLQNIKVCTVLNTKSTLLLSQKRMSHIIKYSSSAGCTFPGKGYNCVQGLFFVFGNVELFILVIKDFLQSWVFLHN